MQAARRRPSSCRPLGAHRPPTHIHTFPIHLHPHPPCTPSPLVSYLSGGRAPGDGGPRPSGSTARGDLGAALSATVATLLLLLQAPSLSRRKGRTTAAHDGCCAGAAASWPRSQVPHGRCPQPRRGRRGLGSGRWCSFIHRTSSLLHETLGASSSFSLSLSLSISPILEHVG